MHKYLIDENLPKDLGIWLSSEFIHVLNVPSLLTDTDIWQYAINNSLIILTKDTDYYNRHMSSVRSPKIVWFRIGNMTKPVMENFITNVWKEILELMIKEHFLIVYKEYIEAV